MNIWYSYRKNIHWAVFGVIIVLAAGLSRLIPPFQSPDEISHLGRAYLISQGKWLLEPIPHEIAVPKGDTQVSAMIAQARALGVDVGGNLDEGLLAFADSYRADSVKLLSTPDELRIASIQWAGKERYFSLWGTVYYFPAIYIPQAVGFFIGKHLHWTVQESYYLVRGLTFLTCISILSMAYKLVPFTPLAMALLMLPMSIFQMLSPTIDGVTTALTFLILSQFLFSVKNPRHMLPVWQLSIWVFILATSRTHLLPMFLLPIYIAWQRRSWSDWLSVCTLGLAAICWAMVALSSNNGLMLDPGHTTAGLLFHYGTHPMAFLDIVSATIRDPVQSMFLQRSFIGILGWLDAPLHQRFYPAFWAGLAICTATSMSVAGLRQMRGVRIALAACALAGVCLIFLALLVTFTPHPATLVQGVQGRYFLVPAILLAYALGDLRNTQTAQSFIVLSTFFLVSISALIMALSSRYG